MASCCSRAVAHGLLLLCCCSSVRAYSDGIPPTPPLADPADTALTFVRDDKKKRLQKEGGCAHCLHFDLSTRSRLAYSVADSADTALRCRSDKFWCFLSFRNVVRNRILLLTHCCSAVRAYSDEIPLHLWRIGMTNRKGDKKKG